MCRWQRAPWGPAHRRWLSAVVGATPAHQLVVQASVRAVHEHTARLPRLEHARREQGRSWRLPPVGEALQALRGVPCPIAVTIVAARGELTRFDHPRPLMRDLGLAPSEDSHSERRQGSSTKRGHPQARHARVAGAWASRSPALQRQPNVLVLSGRGTDSPTNPRTGRGPLQRFVG
jgi:transposase